MDDARVHPLLCESLATRESGIAGYLSVPILSPRSPVPLATLCVVDFSPRAWTPADVDLLADLAAWARSEIELRAEHLRDRARAEEALRASEARLRLALEATGIGHWEMDLRAPGSTRRSPRHDQIFGYGEPVPDWSYERFMEHVVPEDRAEVDRAFRSALEHGRPWNFECRIVRADGAQRWIWARGVIHHDAAGSPLLAMGVVVDVTDQVNARRETERLLDEARTARAEAEAANRAKSQFLAVMSHELRTPLNAISGYTDLLQMQVHGPVNAAQRSALERIQLNQQHLLGLINEVLDYARLESGTVTFDLEDVPVPGVLAALEGLVEVQARTRSLALSVEGCDPGLAVRADPEKLRRVLGNLLGNAVKFTPPGGRVELDCAADPEWVHFHVRDTGIGIPADRREAIFEPFVQVSGDLTRTADGTGLGLAISRDLAAGMGGRLAVESEEGVGSTFTLTLPRADAPAGSGSPPAPPT